MADYKTLENLSNVLSTATDETVGINSFKFDDMEALNADHNISYPLCMVIPPDSTIPNINKGWENYTFEVYILDVTTSSDTKQQEYDKAVKLYSEWISNVMCQRDGDYILEQDMDIERVRNIGNDKTIGVKVTFTMIAPSIIIEANPQGTQLPASQNSNLLAYWDLSDHTSSVDYDTAKPDRPIWTPTLGSQSYELRSLDEHIPFLNKASKEFVFYKGSSTSTRGVGMWSEDFNVSSRSYSVFVLMNTEKNIDSRKRLIARISDDSHSDRSGLYIKEESSELEYYVRGTKAGQTEDSKVKDGKYKVVGFINDDSTDKVFLYNGYDRKVCPNSADTTPMTDMLLYLGAYAPASNRSALDDELLEGAIKAVVIYESAVDKDEANAIINHLMNII